MQQETSRRAVLGSMIAAGVAGGYLSPADSILDQFAPLSGSVWNSASPKRPSSVQSPYGDATLRYDDDGVPHIDASSEAALYYAVGHTQAIDRGFQMDLQRRLYSGTLAEIIGPDAVESDRFHRKLCFREAAEATAEHLSTTEVGPLLEAYAEGVTAGFEDGTLELGFQLLDYEPDPWTPTDTMVVEKIISWTLTGSFRTLRRELLRDAFGDDLTSQLYRSRMDHDAPIIRDQHRGDEYRISDGGSVNSTSLGAGVSRTGTRDQKRDSSISDLELTDQAGGGEPVDSEVVDWLTQFEPREDFGSNSWVIGAEQTAGNGPILSNDPHLSLQAPPVWYEMHLDGPDHRARGVAFPGVPLVVIGKNDFAAWGFTNAGSDVIDFYRYDHDDESYQYGTEQREFDTEEQTIEVAGEGDEQVTVKKSVHGPVIEEADQEVGIAWTGHAATETTLALYELNHTSSFDETVGAIEKFESPTQNFLYADQDDNTLYYMVGRLPVRSPNGEAIAFDDDRAQDGDQIFDGSAREGEWVGFEPFERPDWDSFVPFEELPHVHNPEYLATANQQIIPDDELEYYLAESYSDPYRSDRIYRLLDDRIDSAEPVDLDFLETLGRDTFDGRAADLVGPLVAATENADQRRLREAAQTLDRWNFEMDKDSEAALIFAVFMNHYPDEILADAFEEHDLDDSYYPRDGRIARLPRTSGWFGPAGRSAVLRRALRKAVAEIDDKGYETYGDISHTGEISHLAQLGFLDYPAYERSGSGYTVWNYGVGGPWGGGWEMQVDLDGEYRAILAGGNSGRYFSDHYDDQLEQWAAGEYRRLSRSIEGEVTTEFAGDGQ